MVLTNDLSPLCRLGGYDFAVIFPPLSLDLDEVMGVYPRFEGAFILGGQCGKSSDKDFFREDYDVFVIAFSLIVTGSSR